MYAYGWREVFFYALCIIILLFLGIGYIYIYYNCMFIPVSDLPGYCLSFL